MKKNPIYLYVLLFFSTVGTFNSLASTFISSKSFELSDDFAKQMGLTTAQDKADYVTYMEKSVQVNQSPFAFLMVSLITIAIYFLFVKRDLLKAHYAFIGQIVISYIFSCYNYFVLSSLFSVFSNETLRQRYQSSSVLALLLLTALAALFLGIILYKTLRLRKLQGVEVLDK